MSKLRRQAIIRPKVLWKICETSPNLFFFLINWEMRLSLLILKTEHLHPAHRTPEFCFRAVWELATCTHMFLPSGLPTDLYIFPLPTGSYIIWPLPISLRYHFPPSLPHFIDEKHEAWVKHLVLSYTFNKWQSKSEPMKFESIVCVLYNRLYFLSISLINTWQSVKHLKQKALSMYIFSAGT